MTTTATIFYNDQKWLANEPCFGVRIEAQILPGGSVVVGFLVLSSHGEIQELLDKPATAPSQEQSWENAITYARAVLQEDHGIYGPLETSVL